jgi:hypothetical protein
MKKHKTIITLILAFVYLLLIEKIISLYFFPNIDPFLSEIQQNLAPYASIIKIMLILVALSVIPGYYSLKKNITEDMPLKVKNIFYILIFGTSALISVSALLNIYLTGDLPLSSLLLIYGVIYTLILYKHEKMNIKPQNN